MSAALARVNAMDAGRFLAAFATLYEHAPWAAARAFAARPFSSHETLFAAFAAAVRDAAPDERRALVEGHPELAGAAVRARALTADSAAEQAGAGLDRLSPEDAARFDALNARYRATHGFPFIVCVRRHTKAEILAAMAARLDRPTADEMAEALIQIDHIARLRFDDAMARLEARL